MAEKKIERSLWLHFWYATILPGVIGAFVTMVGILGSAVIGINIATIGITMTGITLVMMQVTALLYWYFSTGGDNAYFLLVEEAGQVLDWCHPYRFMCPRLGTMLATLNASIKLQTQAVFGPRGENLVTEQEIGALLGRIQFSKMEVPTQTNGVDDFTVDDPFNVATSEATPTLTFLVVVKDPRKIRKLDAIDPDTGKCTMPGLAVALGQVAEEAKNHLQLAVAGKSIAWLKKHLNEVHLQIKAGIMGELVTRGLDMEPSTFPVISDFGEPAELRKALADMNTKELEAKAKVKVSAQEIEESKKKAEAIALMADANASARERLAKAENTWLLAEINALKASGIQGDQLALILRQKAIKSGLPILPETVKEVLITIGGDGPGIWKDMGGENPQTEAKTKETKAKGPAK